MVLKGSFMEKVEVEGNELPVLQKTGAALFTFAGLSGAFAAAACCFLPIYLASLGFGTGWLAGIASFSAPNRNLLYAVSAAGLLGGAALLWRQQLRAMTCGPNGTCTRPSTRLLTLLGLIAGVVLFWKGYTFA